MLETQEEIFALKNAGNGNKKQRMVQFFHVQCYSRSLAKNFKTERKDGRGNVVAKEGRRWTIADIAAEANRQEGHIPHVQHPKLPFLVAGAPVSELSQICDKAVDGKTQKGGKAIRRDTPILLAAVYSLPIRGDAYNENKEYCDAFIVDAMRWHEKKYGEVISCIRHEDEGYVHYHCFSASEDARGLIPGYVAKRAEYDRQIKAGASKMEALRVSHKAYIEAMKELQDSYYAELAVKYGLDRYGTRRMRYAPGEVRQKRMERERQAHVLRNLILEEEENRRKSEEARLEQIRLKLKAEEEAFEARQTRLRAEHFAEFIDRERARVDAQVENLFESPQYKQRKAFKDLGREIESLKVKNGNLLREVASQSRIILKLEKEVNLLKRRVKQLRQTVRNVISKIREKMFGGTGEKHDLKR